jgi:hypothetical protein
MEFHSGSFQRRFSELLNMDQVVQILKQTARPGQGFACRAIHLRLVLLSPTRKYDRSIYETTWAVMPCCTSYGTFISTSTLHYIVTASVDG